jgi:rhodanese-related sulfurtransferase
VWPFTLFTRPPGVEKVTADEAVALQRSGMALVDVREPSEFKRGHARGARNVTLAQVRNGARRIDSSRPVIVICESGHRSAAAARALAKQGMTEIHDVRGGMAAWRRAGLPVNSGKR